MLVPSPRRVVAAAVAALVLAGCGGGAPQPITFDTGLPPTFPSTTSSPNISLPLTTAAPGSTVARSTVPGVPTTSAAAVTVPPSTLVAADAKWRDVTGALAGLSSECGTISFVTAAPVADMVITGIGQQGLWAAGPDDQWRALGSGSGSAVVDNRPFAIFFDPTNPERFWEAGGYHGGGVFTTDDGGSTFQELGDLEHLQAIGVDVTDAQRRTLLASVHERAGLFRSTDGGRTWTDITGSLPSIGFITGLAVLGPDTFLIGTTGGSATAADGVSRSTDGGATWTRAFDSPVFGDPLVSAVDGSIYWILAQNGGVIRSTDGGVTWERVYSGAVLSPSVTSLAEMPDGTLIGVARAGLVESTDQGATWRGFGPSLPFNDATSVTYAPQRHAVYVSRFDCDVTANRQPVADGSIQRLDLGPTG